MTNFEPAVLTEPPRDRWQRPLITPPGGGRPVAYTRVTTFIGCLEDTYRLRGYDKRMVAAGLGQRPDLHLRAASLGLQPIDPDEKNKWKKEMDHVADQAVEAARASAKATIGTSVHALTEQMDRGLELGYVPAEYQRHLDVYREATSHLTPVYIERFVVQDELQVGGTPDRVLQVPGHDKLIIGDIKTGDCRYGVLKMAMQLAVYSRSQLYDPNTGERTPMGDIDQERGLIINLDAETARIELFWIDLETGWRATGVATNVRQARKIDDRRTLTEPYISINDAGSSQLALVPEWSGPQPPQSESDSALVNAINAATALDQLIVLWEQAGSEWTDKHSELAAARKAVLRGGSAA